MTAIELKPEDEARKLWEACVSYTGANHQGWCEMNFVKFWDTAAKSQAAEIERLKAENQDFKRRLCPQLYQERDQLRAELAEARSLREELAEQWKDLQREYIKADNGRLQALMDLQSSREQAERYRKAMRDALNYICNTPCQDECSEKDKCLPCAAEILLHEALSPDGRPSEMQEAGGA